MNRCLVLNTFFICLISTQLFGAMSSRADRAFLENADQYQAEDGVHLEDFYQFKEDVQENNSYYEESGPIVNKYLPPVVEQKNGGAGNSPAGTSPSGTSAKKKSYGGYSFSQMAEKSQKKEDQKPMSFSFSNIAKSIQKTPTENQTPTKNK